MTKLRGIADPRRQDALWGWSVVCVTGCSASCDVEKTSTPPSRLKFPSAFSTHPRFQLLAAAWLVLWGASGKRGPLTACEKPVGLNASAMKFHSRDRIMTILQRPSRQSAINAN